MRIELLHHLLDQRAGDTPGLTAITQGDQRLTYGELHEASVRLAGWLRRAGVPHGGRLVITAPVPALLYAASRIGAPFCVVHEQVTGPALEHVLDDAEPSLLVTDDATVADLAVRRGIRVAGTEELAVAAAVEPLVDVPPPQPADPVCLIYTSGSTSRPKAVISTHEQAVFAARAIHTRLRYRRDDIVYSPLSLAFDYGLYQLFLGALGGAHVWLGSGADAGPALLLHNLTRSGATVLPALPALAETLAWLLARRRGTPAPGLQLLTSTGAAMPPETLAALRAAMPGLRVQLMYGLTECKRVSIMPVDEDLRRPRACGRPLPGTRVVVVDDRGLPLPPGHVGEFVVRGRHVMAGYWRRAELTRERFPQPGELRTGDYGWMDSDGYLYVEGRRDDVYKERGFRVSATEIEASAHGIEGVRHAAVVPPSGDRAAVLFVVGEVSAEDVVAGLRRRIEPYKIPRRCLVVDAIPLNHNGKVDKKALAAEVEGPLVSPAT